jgi:hypothetical protein
MAQDSVDAIIDPLHDAFRANIVDAIKGLLADKGLKADLMDWRMLFPTSTCLSATDYDDWCNLLRDPLFLPPSTLQRLLKLRDSTAISPRSSGHVAIFYIRTFTLTVAQLQRVLHILISAKILFASRVLEWQRRIAIVPGDSLVYLRYSGTSQSENAFGRHQSDLRRTRGSLAWMLHILKDTYPEVVSNCLIQEIPHLEIVIDPGHSPVFIREQLVICLIERGALNIAIGGTASSTLDTRDKALFQSLKTDLISNRYAATKEASDCIWLAIQNYARRVQLDAQARHLGPEMGTIVPQDWVNVIAEQATPRTLKNGRAILLMIGYCPPDKALKSMLPFWKCGLETPRVLLNLIENLSQWEEDLSETQRTRAETLVEEGLFPFVNFHPVGEADETGFEPALNVLRSYLQVVRPLIVVSMGYQVCSRVSALGYFKLVC